MIGIEQLKALDAVYTRNDYDDEVLAAMLPYVAAYVNAMPRLRALPLGEVRSPFVMVAGGRR